VAPVYDGKTAREIGADKVLVEIANERLRLTIAQGFVEKLPILSDDGVFDSYPIQRLW